MIFFWQESYDKPRQHAEKQRYYSANKVHTVKAMVVPVVINSCESWTIKKQNAKELMPSNCGARKAPESRLDRKEIKSVNLKGNKL